MSDDTNYAPLALSVEKVVFLPLMNSFNKTEAAVYSCRLCFLRAFPFISLRRVINKYREPVTEKFIL